MDYNIIDDMKKKKEKITMFELSKLKHQQKLLLKELNVVPSSTLPNVVLSKAANDSGQPPPGRVEAIDAVLIGDGSNSHTPPFLLTYEIYNRNIHNCLINSRESSNIIPVSICSKLNIEPQKSAIHIVQLDRTKVQVLGEINFVTIRLSVDPRVVQRIDILIADIPEFIGLILSRDWSEKLHGYISTGWSHMWLPYNGKPNQIKIDREKHMTHTVTEFEQENQPIAFNNNILGNYSSESFFGNFTAQPSPFSSLVQELISQFLAFNISPIPRSQNAATDLLANVASKLLPSEDYSPDRFLVELIFRPSIPDNVTNWRVFNHDEDILNFLNFDKSCDYQIIDESDHELQIKEKQEENSIPKPVVKLEDLFYIKDMFKQVTNSKLQSSTLRFELINLGTEENPQKINLGLGHSLEERKSFIRLLQKKNVFTWKYDDLKTYDASIIQHTIPMLSEQKPVQQKLRKIHPNLESQIKTELNKLLKAKIIFPVRHSNRVSNMVPVRKKNGDIRICIDFRNLNKASQKDNFPLPTMEQTLHSIAGSELMSFLDGFSGYN
eukprot:PITA_06092